MQINTLRTINWIKEHFLQLVGDFIYAISKKNNCIFKKFINRGDDIYLRGREKYEELAFQYWCMTPPVGNDAHPCGGMQAREKSKTGQRMV